MANVAHKNENSTFQVEKCRNILSRQALEFAEREKRIIKRSKENAEMFDRTIARLEKLAQRSSVSFFKSLSYSEFRDYVYNNNVFMQKSVSNG